MTAGPSYVLAMTWRNGLFAHWPVPPEQVRERVPRLLELDTRDGRAWIGVLPFVASALRPRPLPRAAGVTFGELNVRTYVRYGDAPGVYFLDIAVSNRLVAALARAFTPLPYRAAAVRVSAGDDRVEFELDRDGLPAAVRARYRPTGGAFRAEPGSLDHWLTARHRLYAVRDGEVYAGAVDHDPWPLQPAEATVRADALFEAYGLATAGTPRYRYCAALPMTATLVRPVRS